MKHILGANVRPPSDFTANALSVLSYRDIYAKKEMANFCQFIISLFVNIETGKIYGHPGEAKCTSLIIIT